MSPKKPAYLNISDRILKLSSFPLFMDIAPEEIKPRLALYKEEVKGRKEPNMEPFRKYLNHNPPAAIADVEFDNGFVKQNGSLLVPAYMASHHGFNWDGLVSLRDQWYPAMEKKGIYTLCPFTACTEHWINIYQAFLADESQSMGDHIAAWDLFNRELGIINYEHLIPRAKMMIANLNNDDIGVAAEIRDFVGKGPIVGVRTNFTLAENPATKVNPAVRFFLDYGPHGNHYFQSNSTIESPEDVWKKALRGIDDVVKELCVKESARRLMEKNDRSHNI